ncbi:MAG TPA: caspase family protein, partial [Pseudomonadota bacterium]|nr:caspase family protein [Pseudomonadota bacterium]
MSVPSPSVQPTGRCLAILIGINDYLKGSGIPPLRNAVRDVQTVAQVLRDLHGYEVRLVLDGQATLAGLRSLFAQLPGEVSKDTRLILYFAGHGIADEKEQESSSPQGFLIPQDAKQDEQGTYLP